MGKPAITVPKEYKHLMRNDSTPEYKMASIRDFVKANPDRIIKMDEFTELIGSTAPTYVSRLRKEGRLIRYSIKNGERGGSYGYRWIEKDHTIDAKPSEVKVRTLGFEPWPLGNEHTINLLDVTIDKWVESILHNPSYTSDEIRGVLKFKAHMEQEYARVEQQHQEILKNRENEDGV